MFSTRTFVASSRISAAAISVTTMAFRTRPFLRSPIAPLRISPARARTAAASGAAASNIVTTTVIAVTNRTIVRSALTSSSRGIEDGAHLVAIAIAWLATMHPSRLPITARMSASTVSCRTSCSREAPMAARIDSSARRACARTSASDSRFASAVASTTITAANKRSIDSR
jgi:hypothetical protein